MAGAIARAELRPVGNKLAKTELQPAMSEWLSKRLAYLLTSPPSAHSSGLLHLCYGPKVYCRDKSISIEWT